MLAEYLVYKQDPKGNVCPTPENKLLFTSLKSLFAFQQYGTYKSLLSSNPLKQLLEAMLKEKREAVFFYLTACDGLNSLSDLCPFVYDHDNF